MWGIVAKFSGLFSFPNYNSDYVYISLLGTQNPEKYFLPHYRQVSFHNECTSHEGKLILVGREEGQMFNLKLRFWLKTRRLLSNKTKYEFVPLSGSCFNLGKNKKKKNSQKPLMFHFNTSIHSSVLYNEIHFLFICCLIFKVTSILSQKTWKR